MPILEATRLTPLHGRADVILLGGVAILVQQTLLDQLIHAFQRQIRVDRPRAVAQQQREVVHVPRLRRLQHRR